DPLRPPYATVQTVSDPSDPRGIGYYLLAAVPNGDLIVAFQGPLDGVGRFVEAPVHIGGAPPPGRGTLPARMVHGVRVRVFAPDASGAPVPVPLASVSLQEVEWPNRSFRSDTGSDGTVLFPGISEGRFTVGVRSLAQTATTGGCVCQEGGVAEVSVL